MEIYMSRQRINESLSPATSSSVVGKTRQLERARNMRSHQRLVNSDIRQTHRFSSSSSSKSYIIPSSPRSPPHSPNLIWLSSRIRQESLARFLTSTDAAEGKTRFVCRVLSSSSSSSMLLISFALATQTTCIQEVKTRDRAPSLPDTFVFSPFARR